MILFVYLPLAYLVVYYQREFFVATRRRRRGRLLWIWAPLTARRVLHAFNRFIHSQQCRESNVPFSAAPDVWFTATPWRQPRSNFAQFRYRRRRGRGERDRYSLTNTDLFRRANWVPAFSDLLVDLHLRIQRGVEVPFRYNLERFIAEMEGHIRNNDMDAFTRLYRIIHRDYERGIDHMVCGIRSMEDLRRLLETLTNIHMFFQQPVRRRREQHFAMYFGGVGQAARRIIPIAKAISFHRYMTEDLLEEYDAAEELKREIIDFSAGCVQLRVFAGRHPRRRVAFFPRLLHDNFKPMRDVLDRLGIVLKGEVNEQRSGVDVDELIPIRSELFAMISENCFIRAMRISGIFTAEELTVAATLAARRTLTPTNIVYLILQLPDVVLFLHTMRDDNGHIATKTVIGQCEDGACSPSVHKEMMSRARKPFTCAECGVRVFSVLLANGHAFLQEDIGITRDAIRAMTDNRQDLMRRRDWMECRFAGAFWRHDISRTIMTSDFVRYIREHAERVLSAWRTSDLTLQTIAFQVLERQQLKPSTEGLFQSGAIDLQKYCHLLEDEDVTKLIRRQEREEQMANMPRYAYDFETISVPSDENPEVLKLVPYMCSLMRFDGYEREMLTFTGRNCAEKMLTHIRRAGEDCLIVAHNASFDLQFVIPQCYQHELLVKDNDVLTGRMAAYNFDGDRFWIHVRDSYRVIPFAIRDFPSVFQWGDDGVRKQIIDHSWYNEANVFGGFHIRTHVEALYQTLPADKEAELTAALAESGAMLDERHVDLLAYAQFYCEYDVRVLARGYDQMRQLFLDEFEVDVLHRFTLPSAAAAAIRKQGALGNWATKISGPLRLFCEEAVAGGRVALGEGKKWDVRVPVRNDDVNSLYPAAIAAIDDEDGGFPIGAPRCITADELTQLDDLKFDYYIVRAEILEVERSLRMPIVSFQEEKTGKRIYANEEAIGKRVVIDQVTVKLWQEVQGVKFDFLEGVCWTNGKQKGMGEFIRRCYETRKRLKAQGDPRERAWKLLMNSGGYGHMIMGAPKSEVTYRRFRSERDPEAENNFEKWLANVHMTVRQVEYIPDSNVAAITRDKPMSPHKNLAHLGVMILSVSKRIMQRFLSASDRYSFYTDTDCIQYDARFADELRGAFPNSFGKNLGQLGNEWSENIQSVRSIYVGRKAYLHVLKNVETGELHAEYRLKGIPHAAIRYKAGDTVDGLVRLYEQLLTGVPVQFNLCGENSPNLFTTRRTAAQTKVLRNFSRTVRFAGEVVVVE